MGIFDKLFHKPQSEHPVITAPVAGTAVSLQEVNDPTFSQEILGKGIAIRPTEGQIVAPCDGKVDMMFDTGHAVSLVSTNGMEILIHVGLETVQLKGKHYTTHAKTGDTVKQGQPLISFDRDAIAAEGYDLITPIVLCNSDRFPILQAHLGAVSVGDPLLTIDA